MNKPHRCLLHLVCLILKWSRGESSRWHLDHLLHQFGLGAWSGAFFTPHPWDSRHAISRRYH